MKSPIKKLLTAFAGVALANTLGCSYEHNVPSVCETGKPYVCAANGDDRCAERALTSRETAFLRAFFGDEIEPEKFNLRLYDNERYLSRVEISLASNGDLIIQRERHQTRGEICTDETGHVNVFGSTYGSQEYMAESSPVVFGVFMHESAHQWQILTEWKNTRGFSRDYKYFLEANSRLEDFPHEQQAAIIEDYALAFLHASAKPYWLSKNDADPPETLAVQLSRLKDLVEKRFPGAKKLRESRETVPVSTSRVAKHFPVA